MPEPVVRKVVRLRRLVRLYVWVEAAAVLTLLLGVAFWMGLALDWLVEPRPATRAVVWFGVCLAVAIVAFRLLLRRAMAPLASDSLALLIERRHPELQEGLVTTVQAAAHGVVGRHHRQLIDATAQQAADKMNRIRLPGVLDWRRLAWRGAAALGVVSSIALFAAAAPDTYGFWLRRMQFDPAPWPRRVQLAAVGFQMQDGRRVEYVARDDEFELVVLASIEDQHEAPESVEVRWRRPGDNGRGGGPMRRIGEALPGRDAAQEYRFTFKVADDMEFDVVGGDDRIEGLLLRAVERPSITRMSIDCQFPAYLSAAPRTIVASNRVELPEGTLGQVHASASKPLQHVIVRDVDNQASLQSQVNDDDSRQFHFELGPIGEDRRLAVTMHDAQGVENREPYRVLFSVKPDESPEVSVRLRGIGMAVTANAQLPFEGRLSDDHGLKDAWFEFRVNDATSRQLAISREVESLRQLQLLETLDLNQLSPETQGLAQELEPGDRLSLSLRCSDAYNLTDQPHVASSQQFLLDVVTPSELRAILEKRELGLRQRFEAVVEKMDVSRDLLDRIEVPELVATSEQPSEESSVEDAAEDSELALRATARDRARISGIRQNATQLAYESTGLADGFDDIVAEMVNNRVDTVELNQRLSEGIAFPLRRVGGELLPQWEESLSSLQAAFDQQGDETKSRMTAAKAEAEEIHEEMAAILDRMLELENYNELVELLRSIVQRQDELSEETKKQRRTNLRNLLED